MIAKAEISRAMGTTKVGVIGGGQLAGMMAAEAKALDIELVVQTPSKNDPAVSLASEVILAPLDAPEAIAKLASRCEVITFENEFVNLEALQKLAERGACFRPKLASLSPLLDKYHQRCYLRALNIPVPKFRDYQPKLAVREDFNLPVVLKVRRHGYDGQGTVIVKTKGELESTCKGFKGVDLLLEEFIPFERELAVIAARSVSGEIVIYPVVETYQKEQVCHWVMAPSNLEQTKVEQVRAIASKLLTNLDYVGVLGLELFLTASGEILVNEIAPRTHNSGHYTLDACHTSQFAMQLLAITGQPLREPELKAGRAVMVNLLGYEYSQSGYEQKREEIEALKNAHLHWYGKRESRPGRKLGHVTVLFDVGDREGSLEKGKAIAQKIESIWYR